MKKNFLFLIGLFGLLIMAFSIELSVVPEKTLIKEEFVPAFPFEFSFEIGVKPIHYWFNVSQYVYANQSGSIEIHRPKTWNRKIHQGDLYSNVVQMIEDDEGDITSAMIRNEIGFTPGTNRIIIDTDLAENTLNLDASDFANNNIALVFISESESYTVNVSGEIKADNLRIFNYGCTVKFKKITTEDKAEIINHKGTVTIGDDITNRPGYTDIDVKLNLSLENRQGDFGFKRIDGEEIINNEGNNRIFYNWEGESIPKRPFDEKGITKILRGLKVLQTRSETLKLEIDLSKDWKDYTAGLYESTLYITVEPGS